MTTFTTKFAFQERAYILQEAKRGFVRGGIIAQVVVDVGGDGGSTPTVFYKLNNNSVIAPAGGYWKEFELATEAEAMSEASSYHDAKGRLHINIRDDLT